MVDKVYLSGGLIQLEWDLKYPSLTLISDIKMDLFREFSRIFMIVFLGLTALMQLLRIIGLVVEWPILKKLKLSTPPTKVQMFLYYLLAIGACIYSIIYMFNRD